MYIPTWLIIVAAIGIFLYYRSKKKKEEFAPFYVSIQPNWYQLLKDYKLIDENGWKRIQENAEKYNKEPSGYNVLKHGITFTVLKSDENSDLIYNNNHQSFHSEVDFRGRIEEIKIKGEFMPYSPDFCVKWGIDGYDLSITTPESFEKVVMVGDDNDLIKITAIPYGLFHMPKYRLGVLKPEQLKELLKKHRWTAKEQDSGESLMGWPNELRHKYFRVDYKYI